MKKLIISLVCVATSAIFTSVSAQVFHQEAQFGSIGYGFGNIGNTVIKSFNSNANFNYTSVGPLFLRYEYGVSENFGIGLNISYLSGVASFNTESNGEIYRNEISREGYNIMLRFNWHMGDHHKIDPYIGFAGGYRNNVLSSDFNDPELENVSNESLIPFGFEATFGTRFMFSDNIGAYVEVGVARAIMQIGMTAKF